MPDLSAEFDMAKPAVLDAQIHQQRRRRAALTAAHFVADDGELRQALSMLGLDNQTITYISGLPAGMGTPGVVKGRTTGSGEWKP